ncbi:MAG TPA: winged helix-turn-helix domain-containing protein [Candidatus Atribacteria bacterium]|mgnify:FL=1|nr:winged helix-turn-helix domain-containing protein [Candidatus Atribacteria bacterium]
MACVTPEGKPTESGKKILSALKSGATSPEEVAKISGLPLFRVRSGLRDMVQADLVAEEEGKYKLTGKGGEFIE